MITSAYLQICMGVMGEEWGGGGGVKGGWGCRRMAKNITVVGFDLKFIFCYSIRQYKFLDFFAWVEAYFGFK